MLEEFLKSNGITQVDLAKKPGTLLLRINTIINGKRACTAGIAVLLAKEPAMQLQKSLGRRSKSYTYCGPFISRQDLATSS